MTKPKRAEIFRKLKDKGDAIFHPKGQSRSAGALKGAGGQASAAAHKASVVRAFLRHHRA